jgi:hypothetical protein
LRVALAVGLFILGYGVLYDGLQQLKNCPETFWAVMNPKTIFQPCSGSGSSATSTPQSGGVPGAIAGAAANAAVPGLGLLPALGLNF